MREKVKFGFTTQDDDIFFISFISISFRVNTFLSVFLISALPPPIFRSDEELLALQPLLWLYVGLFHCLQLVVCGISHISEAVCSYLLYLLYICSCMERRIKTVLFHLCQFRHTANLTSWTEEQTPVRCLTAVGLWAVWTVHIGLNHGNQRKLMLNCTPTTKPRKTIVAVLQHTMCIQSNFIQWCDFPYLEII